MIQKNLIRLLAISYKIGQLKLTRYTKETMKHILLPLIHYFVCDIHFCYHLLDAEREIMTIAKLLETVLEPFCELIKIQTRITSDKCCQAFLHQ